MKRYIMLKAAPCIEALASENIRPFTIEVKPGEGLLDIIPRLIHIGDGLYFRPAPLCYGGGMYFKIVKEWTR